MKFEGFSKNDFYVVFRTDPYVDIRNELNRCMYDSMPKHAKYGSGNTSWNEDSFFMRIFHSAHPEIYE